MEETRLKKRQVEETQLRKRQEEETQLKKKQVEGLTRRLGLHLLGQGGGAGRPRHLLLLHGLLLLLLHGLLLPGGQRRAGRRQSVSFALTTCPQPYTVCRQAKMLKKAAEKAWDENRAPMGDSIRAPPYCRALLSARSPGQRTTPCWGASEQASSSSRAHHGRLDLGVVRHRLLLLLHRQVLINRQGLLHLRSRIVW